MLVIQQAEAVPTTSHRFAAATLSSVLPFTGKRLNDSVTSLHEVISGLWIRVPTIICQTKQDKETVNSLCACCDSAHAGGFADRDGCFLSLPGHI